LPSLATVVDLFRLRLDRNFEGLEGGLDSVFGVGKPSGPREVWLPALLMRKKFFNLVEVGVCVPDASAGLCFLEKDKDEKFRFSVAIFNVCRRPNEWFCRMFRFERLMLKSPVEGHADSESGVMDVIFNGLWLS
jgi:hypothetical protein